MKKRLYQNVGKTLLLVRISFGPERLYQERRKNVTFGQDFSLQKILYQPSLGKRTFWYKIL